MKIDPKLLAFMRAHADPEDIRKIEHMDDWNIDSPLFVGWPILHNSEVLRNPKSIAFLVSFGADVNVKGDIGETPLHSAATRGLAKSVKLLLELGADPSLKNAFGESPLESMEDFGEPIQVLLKPYCDKK